jgi:hypothetical protein
MPGLRPRPSDQSGPSDKERCRDDAALRGRSTLPAAPPSRESRWFGRPGSNPPASVPPGRLGRLRDPGCLRHLAAAYASGVAVSNLPGIVRRARRGDLRTTARHLWPGSHQSSAPGLRAITPCAARVGTSRAPGRGAVPSARPASRRSKCPDAAGSGRLPRQNVTKWKGNIVVSVALAALALCLRRLAQSPSPSLVTSRDSWQRSKSRAR